MDIAKFTTMLNDKYFLNLKKLKYKYPEDFDEFIESLKNMFFKEIPLEDFNGRKIVYLESYAGISLNTVKLLLHPQNSGYSLKAVENEIISSSAIESIDFDRNSVRNILKGLAPQDEEESRILGQKKGFEFISDINNKITEDNIHKLYMMTVGDFLGEENALKDSCLYRHDSVFVVGSQVEHSGIDFKRLPECMGALVDFINSEDEINDLLKAAMVHFYMEYLHPYFDGNGRMARLVHLWFLVQRGYETALFVPFSSCIMSSRKKYYNAFTLVEDNYKLTGVLDVTPFLKYFVDEVYNKLPEQEIKADVIDAYKSALRQGKITEKESKLWQFVLSSYGTGEFSTKQLEKDYGNAAYATIRSFVIKFTSLGLLSKENYKNRTKYKINA